MTATPKDLDLISDVVLNYRPKEKAKATKQRAKKRARDNSLRTLARILKFPTRYGT